MAHQHIMILFLSSIIYIAALNGSHAVEYTVTNRAGTTPGSVIFTNQIGLDYTKQTAATATDFIWRIFQQNTPADRKSIDVVNLFIDDIGGFAGTAGNQIYISAQYIGSYSGGNVKDEITGIIYHEMTHVWQWDGKPGVPVPGGLIEGIADYVRLKAGLAPSHWVKKPGPGDNWDHGNEVTGYFLDYCDSLKNGFVGELNKKMRNGYGEGYFNELLGKSVDQLWSEYKATFN